MQNDDSSKLKGSAKIIFMLTDCRKMIIEELGLSLIFWNNSQHSPNNKLLPIFSHLQRDLEGEDLHEQVDHDRRARDHQNSQLCELERC